MDSNTTTEVIFILKNLKEKKFELDGDKWTSYTLYRPRASVLCPCTTGFVCKRQRKGVKQAKAPTSGSQSEVGSQSALKGGYSSKTGCWGLTASSSLPRSSVVLQEQLRKRSCGWWKRPIREQSISSGLQGPIHTFCDIHVTPRTHNIVVQMPITATPSSCQQEDQSSQHSWWVLTLPSQRGAAGTVIWAVSGSAFISPRGSHHKSVR